MHLFANLSKRFCDNFLGKLKKYFEFELNTEFWILILLIQFTTSKKFLLMRMRKKILIYRLYIYVLYLYFYLYLQK